MKKTSILILVLMLLSIVPLSGVHTPATSAQTSDLRALDAIADAEVRSNANGTNFGSLEYFGSGISPYVHGYVKFNVATMLQQYGDPIRATLRLVVVDGSVDGPALYQVDSGWDEATVTYSNRPAYIGDSLGDLGAVSVGQVVTWDVTSLVSLDGPGLLSFGFKPASTDRTSFGSLESNDQPLLMFEYPLPDGTPAATSTPTLPPATDTPTTVPPTATNTAVPPTETPTNTAVPPTSTPIPPTNTPTPAPTTEPSSLSFSAVADTYANEPYPTQNYGTSANLYVDGDTDPDMQTFIAFSVTGVNQSVSSAKLWLYVNNASANGPTLYTTTASWTESGLTWNNKPSPNIALGTIASLPSGSWVSYDVTSAVTGNGDYGFMFLPNSTDSVAFNSRQNASNPPRLDLTLGSGPAPTATATPTTAPTATATPSGTPSGDAVVIMAAGDIACDPARSHTATTCHQQETADLISAENPDYVLMLGDAQYEDGTLAQFAARYDPSWGPFLPITYGVAGGSHDSYGGGDFATYFGSRIGTPLENWYSFDTPNGWHIIVLNSYCDHNGNCAEQDAWLAADLAAHPNSCSIAAWHEPRYTSGTRHNNETRMDSYWDTLVNAGVEMILSGHEHMYERIGPVGTSSNADPNGAVAFIVGVGGKSFESMAPSYEPLSQAEQHDTFGVLRLELHDGYANFAFVPEAGKTYSDSGTITCH